MTHLHYPLGALLSPRGKWVVDNRSGWDVGWASSAVHFNSSQFYSTANLDNKSCQSRSWFYWEARVYLFLLCYSAYSRLVTSRSWGHLRTDIWQGTQDLTTHFCGLLFSWFHAKTHFFFLQQTLIQTFHCPSRERLVLWHLYHIWRLKGEGTTDYSK